MSTDTVSPIVVLPPSAIGLPDLESPAGFSRPQHRIGEVFRNQPLLLNLAFGRRQFDVSSMQICPSLRYQPIPETA